MKKFIIVLGIILCSILLLSCDTTTPEGSENSSHASSEATSSSASDEVSSSSASNNDETIDTEPTYSRKRKDKLSPVGPIVEWGNKVQNTKNALDSVGDELELLSMSSDGRFTSPLYSASFEIYHMKDDYLNSYIVYGFEDAKYTLEIIHQGDILNDSEIARLLAHISGDYEISEDDGYTKITVSSFSSFDSIQYAILNRLASMDVVSVVYIGYISEHQYKVPEDTSGYELDIYDDIGFGIWYLIDSYEDFSHRVRGSAYFDKLTKKYDESFFEDNFLLAVGYKSMCYEHSHFLDANYLHSPRSNYPSLYITWLDENCDCERLRQTGLVSIPRSELDDEITQDGALDLSINILNRDSNYYEGSEEYGTGIYEAMKHKVKIEADNIYLAEDKGVTYIDYGESSALYAIKIKFSTPKGKLLALEKLKGLGIGYGGEKVDDSFDDMIILYYSSFEAFKSSQKIIYSRYAPCWFVDEIVVNCFNFYDENIVKLYKSKTLRLTSCPDINGVVLTSADEYNNLLEKHSIEALIDTQYMYYTWSDDITFDDELFEENFVLAFTREYKGKYQYQRHYYSNFLIDKYKLIIDEDKEFIIDGEQFPMQIYDMYITRVKNSGCSIFGDYYNTEPCYYLDFVVIPKKNISEGVSGLVFDKLYKIQVLDTAKSLDER